MLANLVRKAFVVKRPCLTVSVGESGGEEASSCALAKMNWQSSSQETGELRQSGTTLFLNWKLDFQGADLDGGVGEKCVCMAYRGVPCLKKHVRGCILPDFDVR